MNKIEFLRDQIIETQIAVENQRKLNPHWQRFVGKYRICLVLLD